MVRMPASKLRVHRIARDIGDELWIAARGGDRPRALHDVEVLLRVAQTEVLPRDRQQEADGDLGVAPVLLFYQLHAAVEDLALCQRSIRISEGAQNQVDEIAFGSCALGLKYRFVAFAARFDRLPRRADHAHDQHHQGGAHRGDRGPIAAHELAEPVHDRIGARTDGLVVQVTMQIVRQRRDRRIASGRLLL